MEWKSASSGTYTALASLNGTGSVWTDAVSYAINVAAGTSAIDIRFRAPFNQGNDTYYVDNVTLAGDAVAQTPIPGAAFLMGSVLAAGAGFGAYRKKRKKIA